MRNKLLHLAVAIWFVATSAMVLAMNTFTTQDFDHDMRLSLAMMSLDFEADFVKAIHKQRPLRRDTILHITGKDGCFCETLVAAHVSKLNEMSAGHNIDIVPISLKDFPEIAPFVPSTPAVVVISHEQSLLYFGPYSEGSGCFGRSGDVNAVVEMRLLAERSVQSQLAEMTASSEQYLPSGMIVNEAKGCYCNQAG